MQSRHRLLPHGDASVTSCCRTVTATNPAAHDGNRFGGQHAVTLALSLATHDFVGGSGFLVGCF